MNFYTHVALIKNDILLRGIKNGKRVKKRLKWHPYFFVPTNEDSKYHTLENYAVKRMDFDSVEEAKKFYDAYKEMDGFQVYGLERFQYVYIHDHYPKEIVYDPSLIHIDILDIECDSTDGFPDIDAADKRITAISLMRYNNGNIVTFGLGEFVSDDPKVHYLKCANEKEMLDKFLMFWRGMDIDILTGFNVEFFDVPYLVNRIKRVLGNEQAKKLSPWGILQSKKVFSHGREQNTFILTGISILDYMGLYKKFAYIRAGQDSFKESMRLDYIANKELGEHKIDYSEHASLNALYLNDHPKFIAYNIHDVRLIAKLEDKLRFIELIMAIAYDAKINLNDALTSVLLWDIQIYNHLMDRNIVLPQALNNPERELVGAYVKDPILGMHEWVVSFDLQSLYPHIIMGYNISPETYTGKVHELSIDQLLAGEWMANGVSMAVAANGCGYRKDIRGFIPALMEIQFNKRAEYRSLLAEARKNNDEPAIIKYDAAQLSKKIQLNSLYGAMSNPGFRFFNIDHAEAVTTTGQLTIRWAEQKFNEMMNQIAPGDWVIAIDTDSLLVDMAPLVKKILPDETNKSRIVDFLDKIIKVNIHPEIEGWYEDLADRMNAYQQAMYMKREVIADKGIWIAKKRYILNVWDTEGFRHPEPKLKVVGIEAVRSSTPDVCRQAIMDALKVIMNKDETALRAFIDEFKVKFATLPFEDVAFPRGVNGLDKYADDANIYKKATPIHVRGALLYNKLLKESKLKGAEPIFEGGKVKFAYLTMPNPIHENIIAGPNFLPHEFDLDKYIDYELQFEKSFLQPVESIIQAIGWTYRQESNLEGFFE